MEVGVITVSLSFHDNALVSLLAFVFLLLNVTFFELVQGSGNDVYLYIPVYYRKWQIAWNITVLHKVCLIIS